MKQDRLGTVSTSTTNYAPYGENVNSGATEGMGFTGYYQDDTTGLDYAQQRYYAPSIGRFTSPDPYNASASVTSPQRWNRYAYVENDPVNKMDPSGLDPDFSVTVVGYSFESSNALGVMLMASWQAQMQQEQGYLFLAHPVGKKGGSSVPAGWMNKVEDSRKRLVDRIDDDCADAIGAKDSAAAFNKLGGKSIAFKDLGIVKFVTTPRGPTATKDSGAYAIYNPTWLIGGISLNSSINWDDPNNTRGLLDGNEYAYRALDAEAYKLGIGSMTAEQFMDLTILHELAHAFSRNDPDVLENEKRMGKVLSIGILALLVQAASLQAVAADRSNCALTVRVLSQNGQDVEAPVTVEEKNGRVLEKEHSHGGVQFCDLGILPVTVKVGGRHDVQSGGCPERPAHMGGADHLEDHKQL